MNVLREQLTEDCKATVNSITFDAEPGVDEIGKEFDRRTLSLQRDLKHAQEIIDELRAELKDLTDQEYRPTSAVPSSMMTRRQREHKAKKGTFETIAAEASARLSGLFAPKMREATIAGDAPKGSAAALNDVHEPARKPVLPVNAKADPDGGNTPTQGIRSPVQSFHGPDKPAAWSGAITSEEVIELVKSLTQWDEKPKVKEADHEFDMLTPETCRQWNHRVRDKIKSFSDKPDAAWDWLMEVYNTVDERKALEE